MTLAAGTRLGPYEILSALGAGGMSARGHAEGISVSSRSRRGPQRGNRVGVPAWGPSASERILTLSPCR